MIVREEVRPRSIRTKLDSSDIDITHTNPPAIIVMPTAVTTGRLVRTMIIGNNTIAMASRVMRLAVSSAIPTINAIIKIKKGRRVIRFHVIIAYPIRGADSAKSMPI